MKCQVKLILLGFVTCVFLLFVGLSVRRDRIKLPVFAHEPILMEQNCRHASNVAVATKKRQILKHGCIPNIINVSVYQTQKYNHKLTFCIDLFPICTASCHTEADL